jgi:hypothetical protein
MLRWLEVEDKEILGMTVKMYREPFVPSGTVTSIFQGLEFDHYAFKYFKSEIYMYRILDTNFTQYMEERGDLDRLKDIQIPTDVDFVNTVL